MTPDELRRCCLGQPGSFEEFPFGPQVSVFKVAGKVFAIADLNGVPVEVSLKCDPDVAEMLRSERPAIRPGYHLNKRHWNTVTLEGSIADDEVEHMIQDSYDLVVAKLTRPQRDHLRHLEAPPKRSGHPSADHR
jgi:predicted DNA-binding protein (MmcQ/YjbR family)